MPGWPDSFAFSAKVSLEYISNRDALYHNIEHTIFFFFFFFFFFFSGLGYSSCSPTWPRSPRWRRHDAHVVWDLSHSAGACRSSSTTRRRARRRLHLQVPQLRPGRARPSCTSPQAMQERLRSPIQGWFGQRTSSRWSARTRPRPGSAASSRARRRSPGWRGRGGRAAHGRGGNGGGPREVASRRPSCSIALHDEWLAPLGFELGTPRDAGAPRRRTSRCAIRRRGRSAAR